MTIKKGSRLEKLSIRGFKSFAKQTSLIFSPGITAIVGPNGSGKSNVLDALSFVMGSLSFSSLRAKSAENLLHFGKTKKSNDADVSLVIKVDHELAENGELRFDRKLMKDGKSIYKINGTRSTRLATLDSLSAIHIFPDSHNIVRQGDITRFINMSARQRRELIEVVAGIELYERKKTKAMTDLEGVEAKIEKVEAVHGERVRIFNQLKREKDKVNRFNELKKLEESANFSILLKEIEGLKEDSKRLEEDKAKKLERIKKLESEIDAKTNEVGKVNSSLEKRGMKERVEVVTSLERTKMEINKLEEEITRELKGVSTTENRLESIKSQSKGLKRRKDDILSEIESKKRRLTDITKESGEYKKLKDGLTEKVTKAKQDFEKKRQEYENLKSKKDDLVLKGKELELERQSNLRMTNELKKRLDIEKNNKLKFEAEKKRIIDEKKSLENEHANILKRIKEIEKKVFELKEKEKNIVYSSSLPQGVRSLRKKGYKILGEVVNDPSKVMPFAFSIVADASEIKEMEVEEGWVYAVPKDFDVSKLEELSKVGVALGKITEFEFKGESERTKELEDVKKRLSDKEREFDRLRSRKAELDIKLSQKFDSSKIHQADESIRVIKDELKQRKTRLSELESEIEKINERLLKIGDIKEPRIEEEGRLEEVTSKLFSLESEIMRTNSEIKANENTLKNLVEPDIVNYEKLSRELEDEIKEGKKKAESVMKKKEEIEKTVGGLKAKITEIETQLKDELGKRSELEGSLKKAQTEIYELKSHNAVLDEKISSLSGRVEYLERTKPKEITPIEHPKAVLEKVVRELQELGTLNFKAQEEFKEINQLVEDISDRLNKLREEKDAILKMVDEIETQKKKVFLDTFNNINKSFSKVFSEVIEGESRLEIDGEGISIKTRVGGRDLPTESLSGGQKTLAAIAIIFAIQEVKPSPLYVFDEIDAALDKTNSEKLAHMIKRMSETTQIIAITHNDTLVKESDQIVGVYMNKSSSRLVSLPKEKVMSEAESWIGKD